MLLAVWEIWGLFKHAASFLLELSTQLDPALSLRPRRVGHHSIKPEYKRDEKSAVHTHMTFRKGDVEEESGWAHWLLEAYELEVYTVTKRGLLFQNFQADTQLV